MDSRFLRTAWGLTAVSSLIGCASPSPEGGTVAEAYLGLEQPTDGFQVRNVGTSVPAGEDEEYCEVGELPGTPDTAYYVNRVEMASAIGGHHLIISIATPGSKSDAKLRAMNLGDRVPCLSAQIQFGEDLPAAGGIQHPYGQFNFPPGIAHEYYGGSRVVFDYHYFNTTTTALDARSAFNFHLIPATAVEHLAGQLGFFNWTIDTPPGAKGSFTGECRFQNDARVGGLTRHTHKWGRDFSAWYAGGANDGALVWTTPDFNTNTDYGFDPPVEVKAGEGFKFQCNYDNTESYALRFGVKASDEMCILFGSVWDPHGGYEPPKETCNIAWIDPSGLGHPATFPGAFPPPSPVVSLACLLAGGVQNACTQCTCGSCGDILAQCLADKDCGPIVQCGRHGADCQSVVSDHSSGVGLSEQLNECVTAKCGDPCQSVDGGIPGSVL